MVAIFVVSIITSFVFVDLFVRKFMPGSVTGAEEERDPAGGIPLMKEGRFRIPFGTYLGSEHCWVHSTWYGEVKLGIDELIYRAVGTPTTLGLPEKGQHVKRGDVLFALEYGGRRLEVRSPLDGMISEANGNAASDPLEAKRDPYRKGWLCSMQPTVSAEDVEGLRVGTTAVAWLLREAKRMRTFFDQLSHVQNTAAGVVLQDGGELAAGALERFGDDAVWSAFQREFLDRESIPGVREQGAEK